MSRAKPGGRMLAEFLVIVVSILSAFAVEEYRDSRAREALRSTALTNIRAEVVGNIEAIRAVLGYHREVAGSTGAALSDPTQWEGKPGFEVGALVAPQGIQPPALSRTAWETARTTGAVALFDYALAQRIADAYASVDQGVDATVTRLVNHVFSLPTFRPADTEPVLTLMAALAGELHAQEDQLLQTFEALLEALP